MSLSEEPGGIQNAIWGALAVETASRQAEGQEPISRRSRGTPKNTVKKSVTIQLNTRDLKGLFSSEQNDIQEDESRFWLT